jgi:hypothetical protein
MSKEKYRKVRKGIKKTTNQAVTSSNLVGCTFYKPLNSNYLQLFKGLYFAHYFSCLFILVQEWYKDLNRDPCKVTLSISWDLVRSEDYFLSTKLALSAKKLAISSFVFPLAK